MSNDRKLFGGFLGGVTMTVVTIAVSFFQFRILLKHLPLIDAGIWLVFLNIGLYILLLDMGLSPTLGREVSFASAAPDLNPEQRAARIGTLVRSCTVAVMALAIVVFFAGSVLGWEYLKTIVPQSIVARAHPAWKIFIAGAALNLIGEGWFAGIYGLGQVFIERIIRSLAPVFGLLYMCVAIYLHTGLHGLAIAYVIQGATTVLMARYALSRVGASSITKGTFDFKIIRELIVPSIKYSATILGGVLILQTDNLVIASTLGATAIPNYQAATKLVTPMVSLAMMLVVTSQPFISQAFARLDFIEIQRLLNRNLRYTLSIIVVLSSILACFADRIILAWLGPNHFVGFGIIWVLLLVMLLEAHHVAMAVAVMAAGRIAFFVPALLAGCLNLVFSIYLAKRFGLVGVTLGTLCAQVLTNNWYCPWYAMRFFDMKFRDHLRNVILPVLVFLAVMLAIGFGMRTSTQNLSPLLSVIAGSSVACIVGLTYIFFVMLSSEERGQLQKKFHSFNIKRPKSAGVTHHDA